MRATSPDHVVLVSPDPERLLAWYQSELGLPAERVDRWRRGEVPFVSLRVGEGFLIDLFRGERTGTNVDHVALVFEDVDLDELAASGRFDVEMGPMDLWGARGVGRGLYVRDPDGNRVELRTYWGGGGWRFGGAMAGGPGIAGNHRSDGANRPRAAAPSSSTAGCVAASTTAGARDHPHPGRADASPSPSSRTRRPTRRAPARPRGLRCTVMVDRRVQQGDGRRRGGARP